MGGWRDAITSVFTETPVRPASTFAACVTPPASTFAAYVTPPASTWTECGTPPGPTYDAYQFPGSTSEKITLGDLTALNNATKLTVTVWFTVTLTGAFQALFARYNDTVGGDNRDQFYLGLNTANKPIVILRNGATNQQVTCAGSTTLVAGTRYKLTVVFDGAQSSNANRVKMYLSVRSGGGYSADAAETLSFSNTVPSALSAASTGVNAIVGGTVGAYNAFGGNVNDVRVWLATALSQAQVQAEALDANVVTPDLWYPFTNATATNEGSLAGFDGSVTAGIVPVLEGP